MLYSVALLSASIKGKAANLIAATTDTLLCFQFHAKVFAHVLLGHIQPLLEATRRSEQSGFTSSQSIVDALLTPRLLSEHT